MTTKGLIFSILLTNLVQCIQITHAETQSLKVITENLIKKANDEMATNKQKLSEIERLIVDTQIRIENEKKSIAKQTQAIGRFEKLMVSKARDYLMHENLEQKLAQLNSSYFFSRIESPEKILAISQRIFLSNGNYLDYSPGQDRYKRINFLTDHSLKKHVMDFQLVANEIQPLGVAIGRKSTMTETEPLNNSRFSLFEFINQGGIIGKIIILCGFIVSILAIQNFKKINKFSKLAKQEEQLKHIVFGEFITLEFSSLSLERKELLLTKILLKQTTALKGTIDYIRFMATISPMLGLLGTVSGLVVTFQAINLTGNNDSSIVAAGISQALTTTILGLVVAVPSLLIFTLLSNSVKKIEENLEQIAYDLMINEND